MLSRTSLAYFSRRSTPNPRPFKNLQPLGRSQKSQLLCNQANPASFAKMPGVWGEHPDPVFGLSAGVDENSRCRRRNYGTPGLGYTRTSHPCRISNTHPLLCVGSVPSASQRYPFARFSLACGHAARFARHSFTPILEGSLATRSSRSARDHFLLSTFRINTE